MPSSRVFTPPNPLAKALTAAEGPAEIVLIEEAHARIAALAEAIQSFVNARIEQILTYGGCDDVVLQQDSKRLGAAALAVAEVAGAAGLGQVGEVSRGIVAMADALTDQGIWRAEALRLHIDTLQLIGQWPMGLDNEVALRKLEALREALGVAE